MSNIAQITKAACTIITVAACTYIAIKQFQYEMAHADEREASQSARWEARRINALNEIDRGLAYDTGIRFPGGMTSKQRDAIRLRQRVNTACNDRCRFSMEQLEKEIARFQMRSW
jgi:hypothetical protein